jgi:hypothetical protein
VLGLPEVTLKIRVVEGWMEEMKVREYGWWDP